MPTSAAQPDDPTQPGNPAEPGEKVKRLTDWLKLAGVIADLIAIVLGQLKVLPRGCILIGFIALCAFVIYYAVWAFTPRARFEAIKRRLMACLAVLGLLAGWMAGVPGAMGDGKADNPAPTSETVSELCNTNDDVRVCNAPDPTGYRASVYVPPGSRIGGHYLDFNLVCGSDDPIGDQGAFKVYPSHPYSYVFAVGSRGACVVRVYDRPTGPSWASPVVYR
ncbi:hypothetical protein ACFVSN_43985 [Kitasatospora sp. NPDC057904]|uniref:hypothetical protein n=1 Tax=Kitasatospora sp. NPDC057904 TaxID=3346275 RepID=UPI0036D93C52